MAMMQNSTFPPPAPNYQNCLVRGLPINRPFRIHYDVPNKHPQIGSFIILPLQFTIHGSEVLDLTEQTLYSKSKLPEESTSVCQTKVLDTLKNYLKKQRVSNECGKALVQGKIVNDSTDQIKKNKLSSSQANLQAVNHKENKYGQNISWYDSKILPKEPTDRIEFVVLDPISQKIGVKMISKPVNVKDTTELSSPHEDIPKLSLDNAGTGKISGDHETNRIQHESVESGKDDIDIECTSVIADKGNSVSTSNTSSILFSDDDMEISNSDSESCESSNTTQNQQKKSLNLYPDINIKTETETSEYDRFASDFTVLQKSDTENNFACIKVELNDNGEPLKTGDDDVQIQQTEFDMYGDTDSNQLYTPNDFHSMNSAFSRSHWMGQTYKRKFVKQRRSSKKFKGSESNNSLSVKKKKAQPDEDAELKEMQKLKLVKLGGDDDTTADTSCRRSSRLRSVGFRPDYLNVENKIDEFIAYIGGDADISDDEAERSDENAEQNCLDDDAGNDEKINAVKKSKKWRKECIDADFDPELEKFNYRKKSSSKDKNKTNRESDDLEDITESDDSISDCKKADSSNNTVKKVKEKKLKREWIHLKLEDHQDKFKIESLDSIARKDRGKSDLEKSLKVYVCTLCKTFKSASVEGIETHLENHINGKLTCKECGFYASNSGELLFHRTQMHKHLFIICPECGKELGRRHFKTHLGLVHNKPQYECVYCQKTGEEIKKYLSLEHVHRHQQEVHKDMGFTCQKCEKLFFLKKYFIDHEKSCAGRKETENKFCEKCGKTFACGTSLRIHMKRVHLKIRTFQCPECPYSAPHRTSLRHHQLVHEGVHPFHCDQCSFTCVQSYQLTSHMRTHTGEKPYKCTQCKYAAAWNVQLKEHVKVHSMETAVMCHKCDIMFKNEKALNLHVKKEQCML